MHMRDSERDRFCPFAIPQCNRKDNQCSVVAPNIDCLSVEIGCVGSQTEKFTVTKWNIFGVETCLKNSCTSIMAQINVKSNFVLVHIYVQVLSDTGTHLCPRIEQYWYIFMSQYWAILVHIYVPVLNNTGTHSTSIDRYWYTNMYQYRPILVHFYVPVSTDTGTLYTCQYRAILEYKNVPASIDTGLS